MDFNLRKVEATDPGKLTEDLRNLFLSQPLAVLSTSENGRPYCSLVAFASADDICSMVFATNRATRKFQNLAREPWVSLLVDNRSNQVSDFSSAMAVTAAGRASEVPESEKSGYLKLYLSRHPHLEEFVLSPDCALVLIRVDTYFVVQRFQHVTAFRPGS